MLCLLQKFIFFLQLSQLGLKFLIIVCNFVDLQSARRQHPPGDVVNMWRVVLAHTTSVCASTTPSTSIRSIWKMNIIELVFSWNEVVSCISKLVCHFYLWNAARQFNQQLHEWNLECQVHVLLNTTFLFFSIRNTIMMTQPFFIQLGKSISLIQQS